MMKQILLALSVLSVTTLFGMSLSQLNSASKEDLIKILTEPKNALIKQYKKLFAIDDVKLTFENDALEAIADLAIKRKTGARGLRSILEEAMIDIMFDLPEYKGYEIIITKETILEKSQPIFLKQNKG